MTILWARVNQSTRNDVSTAIRFLRAPTVLVYYRGEVERLRSSRQNCFSENSDGSLGGPFLSIHHLSINLIPQTIPLRIFPHDLRQRR